MLRADVVGPEFTSWWFGTRVRAWIYLPYCIGVRQVRRTNNAVQAVPFSFRALMAVRF